MCLGLRGDLQIAADALGVAGCGVPCDSSRTERGDGVAGDGGQVADGHGIALREQGQQEGGFDVGLR